MTTAAVNSISPMLAQSITESQVAALVSNERWACEPKVDGHRCVIHLGDGRTRFISRTGLTLDGVPRAIHASFDDLAVAGVEAVIDAELLPKQGQLWMFDCPEFGGVVSMEAPFRVRRAALEKLGAYFDDGEPIACLPSYSDEIDKARLVLDIKARNAEGVIFRDREAPYIQKRTDRLLKYKFRYDCDCVVTAKGVDGKDNLALAVHDENGRLVDVGTVSALTGDGPKVQVNDVVCVTYLYASGDRRLVQPVTPKLRTDKRPEDCLIDQLIYTDKSVRGI